MNAPTRSYTERDGWLIDASENRASIDSFGSREAAAEALASLRNCERCTNCSDCSYCSDCSDCSRCSNCSRCSDCSRIAYLSDKTDIRIDAESGTSDVGMPPPVPRIENIHQRIYEAVNQRGNSLEMGGWHTCDTTHCRAGWVVHLAGETGYALEKFHNTELAAMLIYRESGYHINPARFYDGNKAAMEDMRRLAEAQS